MKALIVIVAALCAVGCEITDTMDAVQKTEGKMDQMIARMDQMNAEVARTNDTVERQPVVLAFEAMLNSEYTEDLAPLPFNILGFAKEFGKYATDEELVELFYIKIKELNEVVPKTDTTTWTAEQHEAFNHKKQATVIGLQAIAGLMTQEKIETIVENRVVNSGNVPKAARHKASALALLMMRVQFIRDVLLEQSLFAESWKDVDQLEQAVDYAEQINYVATAPFLNQIKMEITGFTIDELDKLEVMDAQVAPTLWDRIRSKSGRLKVSAQELTGNQATDEKIRLGQVQRLESALVKVRKNLEAWGVTQP